MNRSNTKEFYKKIDFKKKLPLSSKKGIKKTISSF